MKRKDRKAREIERALALHRLFEWVERQRPGSSLGELYTVIRPVVRKLRIPFSLPTFYRLFARWQRKPVYQTLVRNWKAGQARISDGELAAVAALALARGQSVAEVIEGMGGSPCSMRTAYRRLPSVKQISRLARLTKERDRLLREVAELGTKSERSMKARKNAGKSGGAVGESRRPQKRFCRALQRVCRAEKNMSESNKLNAEAVRETVMAVELAVGKMRGEVELVVEQTRKTAPARISEPVAHIAEAAVNAVDELAQIFRELGKQALAAVDAAEEAEKRFEQFKRDNGLDG